MIREIHVSRLRVGMFVEAYGEGPKDMLPAQFINHISSEDDIQRLRALGVETVFIDTEKAVSRDTQLLFPRSQQLKTSFSEEIGVASRKYDEALEFVHEFMTAVRGGRSFDHRKGRPLVDGMIGSINRNESAAVSLTRFRSSDDYIFTHSVNVSILAVVLGRQLGMNGEELRRLGLAGLFHDIGKALIPEEVLVRTGRLTSAEVHMFRQHSLEGCRLMHGQDAHPEILRGILEHHERNDGSGYPAGIPGCNMSRFGHILSIVDVFDARTSDRPYAKAIQPSEAFRRMYAKRGQDFDTVYLELFIKALGIYPVGSFVRLSNGYYAVVSESNSDQPLYPRVKVVFDPGMQPIEAEPLDLADVSAGGRRIQIAQSLEPGEWKDEVMRLMA